MKTTALAFLFTSLSYAATLPQPVPHCMNSWDPRASIQIFYPAADRYDRSIMARGVRASCEDYLQPSLDGKPFMTLEKNASQVAGIHLDKYHQNILSWIRRGSNFYFPPGYTASDYVKENSMPVYNVNINRELTQKFGHGFAGEIYREWLLKQPKNASARAAIKKSVRDFLSQGPAFARNDIHQKSQNKILVVSMGLGWDESPEQPVYVRDFLKQIKQVGIETVILKRNMMGTIPENIREITPQLRRVFSTGKDIYLMALCKGMPELLSATADIMRNSIDRNRHQIARPGMSKISGVIGISPMMSGLYWADFLKANPALELIHFLLEVIPGKKPQTGSDYITALETMDTEEIRDLYERTLPNIPSNIPFVNVLGVIPDNGILKNDTTAMMPFIKANKMLNIGAGANDGFLEFPKAQITQKWGNNVYNIPLEGSHMITDGKFDELDFRQEKNLNGLYYGILKFILAM